MRTQSNRESDQLLKSVETIQRDNKELFAKIEENRIKLEALRKQIEEHERISKAGDHIPE